MKLFNYFLMLRPNQNLVGMRSLLFFLKNPLFFNYKCNSCFFKSFVKGRYHVLLIEKILLVEKVYAKKEIEVMIIVLKVRRLQKFPLMNADLLT